MITDSVEIVMFAIRSSIKLGLELREAYVDSTKDRNLVLPLSNFFNKVDIVSATNYFAAPPGSDYKAQTPPLAALLTKNQTPGQNLTPDEVTQVLTYYNEFINLDRAKSGGLGHADDGSALGAEEFNVLITIRQWQRGTNPNPSTLQRIAGTLIEIGVDYFTNVPGALNKNSREGKALYGFLSAMNQIQFSEAELGDIPGRFLVAALDTVTANADLLSADPKIQELVKVTTTSLSTNVAVRLKQLGGQNLTKAQEIGDWGELVFRSVLSSAGGLVLSDPKRFLGLRQPGQAALVTSVGDSVLGLVLGDSGVQVDRLFSRQGLETVTKSALTVLGEHPEILGNSNNQGLQKLLSSISTQLSKYDTLFTPDMLPEITRMILEKTGENLPLLWPDLANKPEQHLLLTAIATALAILTQPANDKSWKPQFSSGDLLTVVEAVTDELAANPTWLLNDAGQVNDNLKLALDAALGVIRNRGDERLSPATAVEVLTAVVTKAGLRKEFLDKLPAGIAAAGQPLIAACLDAIFATIFDNNLDTRAAWQVVRSQVILDIVQISLDQFAKVPLVPPKLDAFATFIKQFVASLATGAAWDPSTFTTKLHQTLTA